MQSTGTKSNYGVGILAAAFLGLLSLELADAQVPQLINYQGRVVVGTTNFNGSGQFKFALVDTTAATTYWSNDGTSSAGSQPTSAVTLAVTQGLYSLLLGDTTLANMTTIPASVFSNNDVRLRIWFNDGTHGFQLLAPDQRIAAVGYAMMAGSVPNGSITSVQLANGAVGSAQIASGAVGTPQLAPNVLNVLNNVLYPIGPSGISIMAMGDSLVAGGPSITDPRQTWPAILSALGFGMNNTVYNFGFSGYSSYSVNAIYAVNKSINSWPSGSISPTPVSTCPATLGGANNYAVIYGSGSDYCTVSINATLSTSSKTVTGMSQTWYRVDYAPNTIFLQPGDGVSGTGIPSGTTITAVGSGQVTLSSLPTSNGTQLLEFTPAAANTFGTTLKSMIAKAKASGYKVAVTTITPAGNTGTPANGSFNPQGNATCNANRLVFNTYIRSLTYDGVGSDPDLLIDLANTPAFTSYNANLFEIDNLHPNFAGNQAIAGYINSALMTLVTPSSYQNPFGNEGINKDQLPTGLVYTDSEPTFVTATTIAAPPGSSQNAILAIAGGTNGSSQYGSDIAFESQVGNVQTKWDLHSDDQGGGNFQLIDSVDSNQVDMDFQEGTTGTITLGNPSKTGTVTLVGGAEIDVNATTLLSLTGPSKISFASNQGTDMYEFATGAWGTHYYMGHGDSTGALVWQGDSSSTTVGYNWKDFNGNSMFYLDPTAENATVGLGPVNTIDHLRVT